MIIFQVSLNFDPVKEILKICQIYILIKKVIILRKMQVMMKTWAPPFFNNFSLSLNRKKNCGSETHEKKTKPIYTSAADLLLIRIENLDWCKCKHLKNQAREIDCLCYWEVDAMVIALVKILEYEGSISPSSLVTHLSLIYLIDEFFCLFLVQLNKVEVP